MFFLIYSISFIGSSLARTILLNPKDSTIASVMQTLTLGGRNYATEASIDSIVMTEASGNTIRYDFINQTYPEELTQNEKDNFGS